MSIDFTREDRIATITLNRPSKMNAMTPEMYADISKRLKEIDEDPDIWVGIITGTGDRAFSAGADLEMEGRASGTGGWSAYRPVRFDSGLEVQKPLIAAINGYCLAGGLELACWCDFRIADATATFGVLNRRWGVPLIDGGTQRLPRIVGLGNALYLIETGAQIDAIHALRMGLAQEVVPRGEALARALELAEAMSSYPQLSLRNDRLCAYEGLSLSLPQGLELEKRLHAGSLEDPAMTQGLGRFASGQRPQPPRP